MSGKTLQSTMNPDNSIGIWKTKNSQIVSTALLSKLIVKIYTQNLHQKMCSVPLLRADLCDRSQRTSSVSHASKAAQKPADTKPTSLASAQDTISWLQIFSTPSSEILNFL